jgi:crossover junction endodeoxyribonuclease RuvC
VRVLGVDPGLDGALAVIETSLDALLVQDMPVAKSGTGTRREVVPVLLAELIRAWRPDVAWVEKVHAMPKQGVSSTFTFGLGYGVVLGVLAALDVPVRLVTPLAWKRGLGLDAAKLGSRAMAMRMFPREAALFARVRDDGRAEAALLAWHGTGTFQDKTTQATKKAA